MEDCARELAILHGGITSLQNQWQATMEISGTGINVEDQPARFQARWAYDGRENTELWRKAKRVYSTTILGPKLAEQAGGAAAARAAGALNIVEIGGSVIFNATTEIMDSLSPEFLDETRGVRSWLWPLTIQNPLDGEGISTP